ncbi:hypothetical protein cypCar_00046428 [Cyprinus carpio]|nr:hypothetical protein cypCar_00046428 [Cyprinus carpio]
MMTLRISTSWNVMRQELTAIMTEISRRFNMMTFDGKLNLKFRPDEVLIDHFCQCCWVQCPFCGATCTCSIENHDGDHSVPFHRVHHGSRKRERTDLPALSYHPTETYTSSPYYFGRLLRLASSAACPPASNHSQQLRRFLSERNFRAACSSPEDQRIYHLPRESKKGTGSHSRDHRERMRRIWYTVSEKDGPRQSYTQPAREPSERKGGCV